MAKEYVVGIDLGTTNSCIAWIKPDKTAEVIPNQEGMRTTPSVIAFSKNGEIIRGEPAKRQAVLNSDRTIKSIKRKMGLDYKISIDEKEYTPQEISSHILKKLITDAESYLGGKISKAVITCPAYFNDAQRQATKEAGQIAGIEVIRVINEPTSAALAYGLDKMKEDKVVVYDLGGGTFDVSVLEIGDGIIQVISTNGDNHLGGDDFDKKLTDWMIEKFRKQYGVDLSKDKQALQRIQESAEKAKIELSTKLETDINIPFVTSTKEGPLHMEITITRSTFEVLVKDLIEGTKVSVENALKDAKFDVKDIDEIILVGGMTRMPYVQKFIKDIFKKEPNKSVNPDECVATGAAIQGSIMTGDMGRDVVLIDVTPLTLGVEVKGGLIEPIIERNTPIPVKKSKIFTTGQDGQSEVEIRVYQGDRTIATSNHLLGSFKLIGIPPAQRGIPQIEVSFDIDTDGIVHVLAKDKGTGKEQSMVVTGNAKLSDTEINKMIEDAKLFEEEDKKKKQEIELKNRADNLIYSTYKTIKEHGDKIPTDIIANIESFKNDLISAVDEDNIQRMTSLVESLEQEILKTGEYIYKQDQAQNGQGIGDPNNFEQNFVKNFTKEQDKTVEENVSV